MKRRVRTGVLDPVILRGGAPASVGEPLPLGPRILSRGRANDSGGEAGHRYTFECTIAI